MEQAATRALSYYAHTGFSSAAPLASLVSALYDGPMPVPEATQRCFDLLSAADDRAARAGVNLALGALFALEGRFAEAAALLSEARGIYEALDMKVALATMWASRKTELERLRDDLAAAEEVGRWSFDTHLMLGQAPHTATRALILGDIALRRGDADEARRLFELARDGAATYDLLVQAMLRSLDARLVARQGRHDQARVSRVTELAGFRARLS